MASIEDFEELLIDQFINITSIGFQVSLLTADFGGGYQAGAITAPYALRQWTLASSLIPDLDDYPVSYELDEVTETAPRFTYFYDFIQRHLLKGNCPFIIRDSRTNKKFLASFTDAVAGANFEQITAKIFSGGIALTERRVVGIDFNADGSIDLDYSRPGISLAVSQNSSKYQGTVTITATVSDNAAIANVLFYIDHESLSADFASPFTASWNTQLHKNGVRKVRALVTDTGGNQNEATVLINVENDITPPTIAFSAPSSGATVTETITLEVSIVETESGIDRVEYYYYDGDSFEYLGDGDSGADHEYELDTTALPNGTTEFQAIAFDNAGNQSDAATRSLIIDNVFNPATIPNVFVYGEADELSGSFADGDPVGTIDDISGNNYDLTSTSTARPTFQTSELNGKPVLQFDGVNDSASHSPSGPTVASMTLAFVVKDLNIGSVDSFTTVFGMQGSELLRYKGTNSYDFGIGGFGWTSAFTMPSSKAIFIAKINFGSNNVKISVNGTEVFNGTLGSTLPTTTTLNSLSLGTYAGVFFGNMKLAGFLGVSEIISTDNESDLVNLWNDKYDIY